MTLKSLKLIGLLILATLVYRNDIIASDDNLSLFKSANQLYNESKYTEALDKYEKLLENGYVSEELYANIGNIYLKERKTALSILNFEKSLLLNSNNKQALVNLKLAKESIINPVTHIPDFFAVSLWRTFVGSQSLSTWVLVHIVFLITAIIFAFFHWTKLAPKIKAKLNGSPIALITIITSLCLSAICLVAASQRQSQLTSISYGIVMSEGSPLLDGPDNRSNEIASLSEGLKAKILDQIDEWYKIQLEDKDEGWVQKDIIGHIKI